ncbi:MAG: hypothetical protein MAG431_00782 [Chloroflexi bacterium]|nr:hypothetical protein [Chloroflexota bacterium]
MLFLGIHSLFNSSIPIFSRVGPAASAATTPKDNRHPDHVSKVIPTSVVIDFVDSNPVVEKGDDEVDRRDDTVPQYLSYNSHISQDIK